jgi:hypothetical protein
MNSKGTKYGVLSSYDTLFVDNPRKIKIFEAIQRRGQPATGFDFSWRLVMIHDSSITNVHINNLLPTPIAHPLLEEKAFEKEADQPTPVVEGPPPSVVGRQRVKVYI